MKRQAGANSRLYVNNKRGVKTCERKEKEGCGDIQIQKSHQTSLDSP